jgi:hypothetical protein
MATALYIVLKLAGFVNENNDWVNICQLVGMDSITFVLLLHLWRRGKP